MNAVLSKLKLKEQNPVLILNPPEEYQAVMADIKAEIHTEIKGKYSFIQLFAKDKAEVNACTKDVIEALEGDGFLWVCYPKGTSKKYKSALNRTTVVEPFAPYNFEPVTQVAIDDDWSAMRLRDVDNIKTMKRKTALSEKGKEKIMAQQGC